MRWPHDRRTLVGMPTPAPTRTGWAAPRGPFPQPQASPRPDGLAGAPLFPLVQHHLETYLAEATPDPDGDGIPQWVEDEADIRIFS